MQRSASRSPRRDTNTPSSVGSSMTANLAHVFHMAAEHRLIVFDRMAPLSYFRQLNDIWRHPPHVHALALHEVHSPPPDLASNADSTFILELCPDCNRRATPTDVLILLDIVIADVDATSDPTHLRRVVWSRRMMSRQGIFLLRLRLFVTFLKSNAKYKSTGRFGARTIKLKDRFSTATLSNCAFQDHVRCLPLTYR